MREYYPFPALLKTEYNEIEELGHAQIAPRGNALNFYGDFVPLVPLGHPATVQWVLGERVLATFEGDTYLSTSSMLQLTDLEEGKLATARTLFQTNTKLPAMIANSNKKKVEQQAVQVLYLSMGLVKLLCKGDIAEGQELYLYAQADFLTLNALQLTVHKKLDFHEGEKLVLCEVESMTQENYISLSAYTAKLEKQAEAEWQE